MDKDFLWARIQYLNKVNVGNSNYPYEYARKESIQTSKRLLYDRDEMNEDRIKWIIRNYPEVLEK